MDDDALITMLFNRDENAVAELSNKYGGLCRSLISNLLKDKRDIEECLNAVYLKLWNSIPPARPDSLKAYTAKAARNEALSLLRGGRNRPENDTIPFEELENVLPSVETEAESLALKDAIQRFLYGLSKEKRVVFLRRYWYFESIEKIALSCGMKKSKVTSMLFRLRNELRAYLEREELF